MGKILRATVKTILMPAIVYSFFLCVSFERFSNINCISTIFLQSIIPSVIAYSIAFGDACGIFDFTVGARIILAGIVAGLITAKYGVLGMLIAALVISLAFGVLTGVLNYFLKIPSLVLTMGLTMVFEVMGKQFAGQFSFVIIDREYTMLGSPPYIIVVFVIALVLFYFSTNYTEYSFHMKAVGCNELVAKNSGIPTDKIKFLTFVYGGFFVTIAAVLTLSQSGTVGAQTGLGSVTVIFKPIISIMMARVLRKICDMSIGIFISQFTINTIFIGLIAVGMPDTFQNVVLGIFLLIVMIFFKNYDFLKKLPKKTVNEAGGLT